MLAGPQAEDGIGTITRARPVAGDIDVVWLDVLGFRPKDSADELWPARNDVNAVGCDLALVGHPDGAGFFDGRAFENFDLAFL